MLELIPRRALFRYELPIRRLARAPRIDGDVRKWSAEHLVPPLVEIEGKRPVADVYWGWNEEFFAVAFDVPDRRAFPEVDTEQWWKRDGFRLCLSTRDVIDARRGTRFCHFFYFLAVGGGRDRSKPIVGHTKLSRSKEPPPVVDVSQVHVASIVDRRRVMLEALIPASCLNGWDPADHPRVGVFYKVRDGQVGDQHLTVGDDLGWNSDPSTWATGLLVE